MKMELRAGLDVVKMIVVAGTASALTLFVLETVPLATLGYVFGVAFVVYMLYIMYSIRLSQLKYEAKLKDMRSE